MDRNSGGSCCRWWVFNGNHADCYGVAVGVYGVIGNIFTAGDSEGRIMEGGMSQFITELDFRMKEGSDTIYILNNPLIYYSSYLKSLGIDPFVKAPGEFHTDLASVPRVPIVFALWGNRCHRESVEHDLLFRKDSKPNVGFWIANRVFLEAMECRGKPAKIRYLMYWGVCLGSYLYYHKRRVGDKL